MFETSGPKHEILKLFLGFVSARIPIADALMTTMGGRGHEAQLWKEYGVQPANGWLIERNRRLSDQIIRERYYHYCASLAAFAGIMRTVKGTRNAYVDGFHLDLCGTLEARTKDFKAIPSLIMRSKGRCLAITVADERRNLSLEHWDQVRSDAQREMGEKDFGSFFHRLNEEQEFMKTVTGGYFGTACSSKRELGFFLNVLLLLKKLRGPKIPLPNVIRRYVYVSTETGHPFRMRTYFFHFGNKFVSRGKAAKRLMKLWQKSSMFIFRDNQFQNLEIPEQVLEKPEMTTQQQHQEMYPKLRAIAQTIGGEVLAEFQAMAAAIEETRLDVDLAQKIRTLVVGSQAIESSQTQSSSRRQRRREQPSAAVEESQSGIDELQVKLNLLRASAQGEKALEEAYTRAYKDLGLTGRKYAKKRRRIVGAKYAWTQGKFRKKFLKACIEKFGIMILQELAELYSTVTDEVKVSDLQREADMA